MTTCPVVSQPGSFGQLSPWFQEYSLGVRSPPFFQETRSPKAGKSKIMALVDSATAGSPGSSFGYNLTWGPGHAAASSRTPSAGVMVQDDSKSRQKQAWCHLPLRSSIYSKPPASWPETMATITQVRMFLC
ncbi:uncharacterized protein AAES06_008752 isoform 1-T1 [Glossophaga mutica]